jgi:hypothetical protein
MVFTIVIAFFKFIANLLLIGSKGMNAAWGSFSKRPRETPTETPREGFPQHRHTLN